MVSQQVPEMKEQGGQLSQAINQFEKAISNITVPDSMTAN